MSEPTVERAAIALYDRFTHEGMDRRAFMAELTRIAGGAAAATALLASIACQAGRGAAGRRRRCPRPRPAARMGAAPRPPLSRLQRRAGRGRRASARWSSSSTKIAASTSISATSPGGSRVAGFSRAGARFPQPRRRHARATRTGRATMIGALDMAETVADGAATIHWLASPAGGSRKVGLRRLLLGRRPHQPARGRRRGRRSGPPCPSTGRRPTRPRRRGSRRRC